MVPPINFAMVVPGVYRSGHPNKKNFGFLRRLRLKGIMSVVGSTTLAYPLRTLICEVTDYACRYVVGTDEYRKDSLDFVKAENLQLHRFDLSDEEVSSSNALSKVIRKLTPL